MRIWRAIFIVAMLVAPIHFGYDSARNRYESSKKTTHIHQYWLPAHAEVTTDKSVWEKKLAESDLEIVRDFSRFKKGLGDQKHIVLIEAGMASYASLYGKMGFLGQDLLSGTPDSTSIKGFKHIGEGKVEFQLERHWPSLIAVPAICAIVGGVLTDLAMIFMVMVCWFIYSKIYNYCKGELYEFKGSGMALTQRGVSVNLIYQVHYRVKGNRSLEVSRAVIEEFRTSIHPMTDDTGPAIETSLNAELTGLIERINRKMADTGCNIKGIQILSVECVAAPQPA